MPNGYFIGKHSSGESKELQTNVPSDHFFVFKDFIYLRERELVKWWGRGRDREADSLPELKEDA